METCPLTENLHERLDIIQRKMMRRMIGWNFVAGDSWEMAGHKMKNRLQQCTDAMGIKKWSDQIMDRKRKVRGNPNERNYWMYHAIRWYPPCCSNLNYSQCGRARGGQYTKWDDNV